MFEMSNNEIITTVDCCLESLCREFSTTSSLFFTERDLICRLYSELYAKLGNYRIEGSDGRSHLLIHTEYSVPFKGRMGDGNFREVTDHERGGRGKYDLVVLNPAAIKGHTYPEINCQSYPIAKETIIRWSNANNAPIVLYGIEFGFRRKPLTHKDNSIDWNLCNRYLRSVRQDFDKLRAGVIKGYIGKIKTIFFIGSGPKEAIEYIRNELPKDPDAMVCCGELHT